MKTYLAQFEELPRQVRRNVIWRTLMVFAIMATLSGLGMWEARRSDQVEAHLRFEGLADKVVIAVKETMDAYEQVLRGGVGLFHAFGTVTRAQWAAYVASLKLAETYPGIQGVGFATIVKAEEIAELEESERRNGLADFTVRPAGVRELNTAILYLEPLDWRNRRALGYDMYSEPVRRKAMQRALEAREPSLSDRVTLIQETDQDVQAGVLLYLPVNQRPVAGQQVAEAERKLVGFVFSPFRMRDLMSRVLEDADDFSAKLIRVAVYNGTAMTPASLLFDSSSDPGAAAEPERAGFIQNRTLTVHGTTWHFQMSSRPLFESQVTSWMPWLIGLAGIVLGSLAAALFGIVNLGKESAHMVADKLGAEVETRKRAEAETRLALRELAHRVKNTLTIVTAISSQTVRHSRSLDDFDAKFRERLLGLSRVHDLLTSGRSYATDLAALVDVVLKPYRGEAEGNLETSGPAAPLAPNTAIMLSMLFNELATNATKYGAWSTKSGSVRVNWELRPGEDGDVLGIVWRERGGPPVKPPQRRGFGSNVITFSIERSLRGKAKADYAPEGITYEISIPWSPAGGSASG